MIFLNKYTPQFLIDFKSNNDFKNTMNVMINDEHLNILINGNCDNGKSTILNIIINEYFKNINNYEMNIMRINSLGDNGIHFFRNEVKTFCKIPSTIPNKKKVVLLDDIDLLNESNQQIFRNFIDNYSNNVFFLASCINIHKVIETIQSRLIIVKLPNIKYKYLYEICNNICDKEKIRIDEQSKNKIVVLSNNSVRTLISYLEKIYLLDKKIDETIVNNICTNINFTEFYNYTDYLFFKNKTEDAIKIFIKLNKKGYSIVDILNNYFLYLKITDQLNEHNKYKVTAFICSTISNFYVKHDNILELFNFTYNLSKII